MITPIYNRVSVVDDSAALPVDRVRCPRCETINCTRHRPMELTSRDVRARGWRA